MTQAEFRDTLAKLRHVDRQPWMGDAFWRRFRDDPVRAFLEADDEEQARLWAELKGEGDRE
jgi:hypothetical protein